VRAILDWLSQIGMRRGDARARNVLDQDVTALGGSAALSAIASICPTLSRRDPALCSI
jgi:hypothetical protein